jgi:hypothetical protein
MSSESYAGIEVTLSQSPCTALALFSSVVAVFFTQYDHIVASRNSALNTDINN